MTNIDKLLRENAYKQLDDCTLAAMMLCGGKTTGKQYWEMRERLELFKASELYLMNEEDFCKRYHLCEREYFVMKVAFEMGKRCTETKNAVMNSPENVYRHILGLGDFDNEHFRVLYLNASKHIIDVEDVSFGGIDCSIVDPRVIFHNAIEKKAHSIICAHNHPSGNMEPSREDINTTARLIECGKLLSIEVADHLIVSRYTFRSIRRERPNLFEK